MKYTEIEIDRKLETPIENETQKVLREALMRLEGGKRWCREVTREGTSMCSHAAIEVARGNNPKLLAEFSHDYMSHPAHLALKQAARAMSDGKFGSIEINDDALTFKPVQRMFGLAYTLAGHKALPQ